MLQDRTVLIVGGTSGMGLSAARACSASGANVVVVGLDDESVEAALAQLGDHAAGVTGDATDPTVCDAAVELAVERFGRLDGLYHVAGGSGRKFGDGPLHEVTDQGIEQTLDLNLTSILYSNRAAVKRMLQQEAGGSIVNMASVLADHPSPQFFSTHTYAAAKAGTIGLTRSCAAYYAKDNIRFNAIAPGLIATPMSQRAQSDDTIQQYIATKQPLDGGRMGRPDDVDGLAVFLLSDASRFVTGQSIAVDGGWSVSEGQAP